MRQRGDIAFSPEPADAPQTTRLRGGRSPRLLALLALVVLGAVAWVGFSNRPTPRDPQARPSFPIAQASPTPAGRATPRPTLTPEVPQIPGYGIPNAPSALLGVDAVAVIAQLEGRTYLQLLRETEPGHLTGAFRAPFEEWGRDDNTLELAQLWTRETTSDNFRSFGLWLVDMTALTPEAERTVVFERAVPARPRSSGPRLVILGFRVTLSVESRGRFGMVLIDVVLGPRTQLRGDDGLAGGLVQIPQVARPKPAPAVPLIILTASRANPERATRTFGESWVAGW